MTIIGIDPGKHGGIALVCGGVASVGDMPLIKVGTKEHIDRVRLIGMLDNAKFSHPDVSAIVEKQQPYPNQGSVSNYSTGFGFGCILTALDALRIPYEEVTPQTWQKHYAIKKDTKGQSCAVAEKLFPGVGLRGARGAPKDGRADALLIAEYGRRKRMGRA